MGCKRIRRCGEERKLRQRAEKMAKTTLAANLKDDLSSYNEEIWTEGMKDDESIGGERQNW